MKSITGFTLIELLVAISILAIISTIAISVFASSQKSSRDGVRIRDLNTIKQALELYRSDQGFYPPKSDYPNSTAPTVYGFALSCGNSVLRYGTKFYLPQTVVKDPGCDSRFYIYEPSPSGCTGTSCSGFYLCALREGSSPDSCGLTSLSCGSGTCNIGTSSD